MNPSYVKKALAVAVILLFIGVTFAPSINTDIGKASHIGQLNNPPYVPSNPYPLDGSINVSLMSSMRWTGGDPDGDPVTYDVYFGRTNPPPWVISNITNTLFFPPYGLEYNTTYYWKIVAWDNHGASSEGPIWCFTTVINDADLECWGDLTWSDVEPGETVYGQFWIQNSGRQGDLYWWIEEWPSWGIWDFGSYFPKIPPGCHWIVFVNVTAPNQENETFTGHVKVVNKNNASDFGIINASLTTHTTMGYNVSERIVGIIGNLQVEENVTSFNVLIGLGIKIIEYDNGGRSASIMPYFFMYVCWSGDFLFDGTLLPHFIKGIVRYRVN